MRRPLTALACAKVNLTLRVKGVRADGYHDIESLVVFAGTADSLTLAPGGALSLTVHGPFAKAAGPRDGNLVLKAARALAKRIERLRVGRFRLDKRLPVAAGLGGGSADAAAALRLLARANGLRRDDPRLIEAARATGADVPVCVVQRARMMRGIGEILSAPLILPKLHAVLANPGFALATREVFAAFDSADEGRYKSDGAPHGTAADAGPSTLETRAVRSRPRMAEFVAMIAEECNDLESAAIVLRPAIADVLDAMRACRGCRLARMSGAGATCFGLFPTASAAASAARSLRARHRDWWVRTSVLGG